MKKRRHQKIKQLVQGESPRAEIQKNDHRGCVPNRPAIPHIAALHAPSTIASLPKEAGPRERGKAGPGDLGMLSAPPILLAGSKWMRHQGRWGAKESRSPNSDDAGSATGQAPVSRSRQRSWTGANRDKAKRWVPYSVGIHCLGAIFTSVCWGTPAKVCGLDGWMSG